MSRSLDVPAHYVTDRYVVEARDDIELITALFRSRA